MLAEAASLLAEAVLGKPTTAMAGSCQSMGDAHDPCGACGSGKAHFDRYCWTCNGGCSPYGCAWCYAGEWCDWC